MHLYHGTTLENLIGLIESDFGRAEKTIWNCSNENCLYFYSAEKMVEYDGAEEGEDAINRAINRAFESGQIGAALWQSKKTVVLEFDVEENLIEDDFSCPNMEEAHCVDKDDLRGKLCGVYIADFNIWFTPWVLGGLVDSEYFNSFELDDALMKVIHAISESSVYLEEVFEFDWKRLDDFSLENLKKIQKEG